LLQICINSRVEMALKYQHGGTFVLRRYVRIPIYHLQGLPAPDLLDEFDIQTGHVHLRSCRMPEIVEAEILNASPFERPLESSAQTFDWLPIIMSKNKLGVKSFLLPIP